MLSVFNAKGRVSYYCYSKKNDQIKHFDLSSCGMEHSLPDHILNQE